MSTFSQLHFFHIRWKYVLLLFLFSSHMISPLLAADRLVRIGILANRSRYECMQRWSPTAIYLSRAIEGYEFMIIPLLFDEVEPAVANNKIDFILTNPSIYVDLEIRYKAGRIATLKNLRLGKPFTKFGGVIFYKADRNDIKIVDDLKGKVFSAVNQNSLGGWQAAWLTFKKNGIDPYEDFKSLRFTGSQDNVIYEVRDGKADAGAVRTDALERLAAAGKINLHQFKIFPHPNHRETEAFPFLHSTDLYPEWPFARIGLASDSLAQEVAVALLDMPPGSPAAKAAKCAGWAVPLSYQPVRECLKALKTGPFKHYGEVTIWEFILQNKILALSAAVVLIIIILFLVGVIRLNTRLQSAKKKIEHELKERELLEIQLAHAQKMEAIGQLAAGIAHEINTPSQFINDNLTFLTNAFKEMGSVIQVFKQTKKNYKNGNDVTEDIHKIEETLESADMEFLEEEIPQALEQSLLGIDRIRTIVKAMKEFSHPSGAEKTYSAINHAIESTIIVSANEWKYVAELKTKLDPSLPPIPCYIDELNQVFLNMIVNAAHAIEEIVSNSGEKGTITIKTKKDGNAAEIRICDTGAGIPKDIQHRIFDPFFTTKEVGKGTGQGLAISYDVIVNKHNGELQVESEPGKGTTFIIRLPLDEEKNLTDVL